MSKRTRLVVITGLSILLFGVIFSFGWLNSPLFNNWATNQYFGKISTVKNDLIIIIDKKNTEKNIILDEKTKIMMSFRSVGREQLIPNASIIVVGESDTKGNIHAKVIRIFNPKNRR